MTIIKSLEKRGHNSEVTNDFGTCLAYVLNKLVFFFFNLLAVSPVNTALKWQSQAWGTKFLCFGCTKKIVAS